MQKELIMIYHETEHGVLYRGNSLDVLKSLPDESIDCCVTSPPYWGLRDYGCNDQLGLEKTPEEYVSNMVQLFREVRRVLRQDGALWLNLGDSYAGGGRAGKDGIQKWGGIEMSGERKYGAPQSVPIGLKPKDLVGIPWRVAFALQADGWYLRQDIIWHKPNPMPESVKDRCTKSHEYIFLMSKSPRYYFDSDAIKEPANYAGQDRGKSRNISPKGVTEMDNKQYDDRNKRSVWTVPTKPFKGAHFATFPITLIEPMVMTTRQGAVILDPFFGSGTTGLCAVQNGRRYIGIDLNPEYCEIAKQRIAKELEQTRIDL